LLKSTPTLFEQLRKRADEQETVLIFTIKILCIHAALKARYYQTISDKPIARADNIQELTRYRVLGTAIKTLPVIMPLILQTIQ
jgi:nitrous oxide reductase